MADTVIRRLVMGNWKMNGALETNVPLLQALLDHSNQSTQLAVCVPFPYLGQAASLLKGSAVSLGAQDVSPHDKGAYTGEVSAAMLADFSCQWVLVGHSERRLYHGETDQLVANKAKVAIDQGITPVVCIGESLSEHNAGHALGVVARQLAPVLALGAGYVSKIVVAYEPVWAIGTGQSASPQQAQEIHAAIRASLAGINAQQVQILYGGSVNAANAADLFSMPDIDGALIGGASLDAQEFLRIAAV